MGHRLYSVEENEQNDSAPMGQDGIGLLTQGALAPLATLGFDLERRWRRLFPIVAIQSDHQSVATLLRYRPLFACDEFIEIHQHAGDGCPCGCFW